MQATQTLQTEIPPGLRLALDAFGPAAIAVVGPVSASPLLGGGLFGHVALYRSFEGI